jgi:hypothetical protein
MKKRRYERPLAMDLSGATARGQAAPPPGSCTNGQAPAQPEGWCISGSTPSQSGGSCTLGLQPTSVRSCNAGFLPLNACSTGSAPQT